MKITKKSLLTLFVFWICFSFQNCGGGSSPATMYVTSQQVASLSNQTGLSFPEAEFSNNSKECENLSWNAQTGNLTAVCGEDSSAVTVTCTVPASILQTLQTLWASAEICLQTVQNAPTEGIYCPANVDYLPNAAEVVGSGNVYYVLSPQPMVTPDPCHRSEWIICDSGQNAQFTAAISSLVGGLSSLSCH